MRRWITFSLLESYFEQMLKKRGFPVANENARKQYDKKVAVRLELWKK